MQREKDDRWGDRHQQSGEHAERGASDEPSATDFIVVDLPRVVEDFALRFDELPQAVGGIDAARMLIGAGAPIAADVIYGIETSVGVVELVGIELHN